MELGEKLRNARLEAGLSQRQLCEGIVTRNMLSQIENGSAKPSMKTLMQMAERLGKPISFFLEERAVLSPNQEVMTQAREGFDREDYAAAIRALETYQSPDEIYDREFGILWNLCHIELAGQQIRLGKERYAEELLKKANKKGAYLEEAMQRQRLLLLGQIPGRKVAEQLPSLDEELLLRAREAQTAERMEKLLEAMENRDERWYFLRGKAHLSRRQYKQACKCFHRAEHRFPAETAPLLEICYRELEDYQKAYFYAVKQKERGKA